MLGDTLLAVVEACAPTGPIVLVGHSLGGMTVLNALRRHVDRLTVRVSGVVLVSTTASARNERRGIEAGIRGFARSRRLLSAAASGLRDRRVLRVTRRLAGVSNDATMLIVRSFGLGPDVDARVADTVARMVLACPPETALGLVDALLSVDEDEALALLPPTTALVGERDMLTPAVLTRRMVTLSQGRVRARELARIGHMVPLEAPEALTDAIVEHLSSAEAVRDDARSAG
jgi:pimeloyl-ACP methyl ester carboxylesterase